MPGYAACVLFRRARRSLMFSNRLLIGALAAACMVAAGAGGYIASRQNAATPVSVAAAPAPVTPAPAAPAASTDRPVQETEGIVGDTNEKARASSTSTPSAAASSAPSAASRRSDAA